MTNGEIFKEIMEEKHFCARVEARVNRISYSSLDRFEVFNGSEFVKDYDRASRK